LYSLDSLPDAQTTMSKNRRHNTVPTLIPGANANSKLYLGYVLDFLLSRIKTSDDRIAPHSLLVAGVKTITTQSLIDRTPLLILVQLEDCAQYYAVLLHLSPFSTHRPRNSTSPKA